MNCSCRTSQRLVALTLSLSSLLAVSCQESLPVYTAPANILAAEVVSIEQLNDRQAPPGAQAVRVLLSIENRHDEVFFDSVDIRGMIRFSWDRKRTRGRMLSIAERNLKNRDLIVHRRLLLVPGQRIFFEVIWNMKSDDSLYLPSEMNFAEARKRQCYYNVICADPEVFTAEASLKVFNSLAEVATVRKEFTFVGRAYIL